jgi:hypothetical protein
MKAPNAVPRNENGGPHNKEQVNSRKIFIICHNLFPTPPRWMRNFVSVRRCGKNPHT